MKFNTYTLGELVTIKYGKNQKKVLSENGTVPIYGTGGLMGYATESLYDKPSVLIGRKGTIEKIRYVDHPFWTVDTLFYTIVNENLVIPQFLYYMMLQLDLLQYNEGTTIPSLRTETLNRIEFQIPKLDSQRKVLKYLATLDDKIELNTAINENLEQQAHALFKAWFVDFEPFGGVMPDDWRIGTISEICGYSKDKVDIDDLTLDTYYSTENMRPNRQGAVQATTLPTIKQTTACKKGDVLISNIRPYFKKILYCFSDCGCSTDVLCFVPNKAEYSAFLHCALYADKFFDYMIAGSKGTKMPRGDKQQIMMYPICIPSTDYIQKFNQAVAPMLETVYTNRVEANNLANLRDTLLPKLMNGDIDVSAVNI